MDIANPHNLGDGAARTPIAATDANVEWRQSDYAWTHSAPVEGLFIVLTIAIVPVAVLRWMQRLSYRSFVADNRRRRDVNF
jgi:hypothetical protein